MDIAELIDQHRDRLSPAERRVADVVLAEPEFVAFGTVADVAERAGTSGASVVRLANRLGLDGYSALQDGVQQSLARRLRPASERIRQPAAGDVVGKVLAAELDNLHGTFDRIDRPVFAKAVNALVNRAGRVFVLSGQASSGIASQFAGELAMLRDGVVNLNGSEVTVHQGLALAGDADVLVVLDLRRYDRVVLSATRQAARNKLTVISLTDRMLSPLAGHSSCTFVVHAQGAGPFDSYVGALALLNALAAAVAGKLRSSATARLDRVEAAWRAANALVDDE